jgi:hypothetical protein
MFKWNFHSSDRSPTTDRVIAARLQKAAALSVVRAVTTLHLHELYELSSELVGGSKVVVDAEINVSTLLAKRGHPLAGEPLKRMPIAAHEPIGWWRGSEIGHYVEYCLGVFAKLRNISIV